MLYKIIEPIKNPKEDFGKQEWISKPMPALEFESYIDKLKDDQ